ncbi:Cytochrome P450 [Dillenia turbinata]|uniref:Cytochrome P450 n=1 Tax=Dillenia turbinata TaxID=194707 RepID=A0AAN8VRX8_9MAGN
MEPNSLMMFAMSIGYFQFYEEEATKVWEGKQFQFINTFAIETLDQWSGRNILVLEEASTFTLGVIGNMIMGLEPTGEEQEKFRSNFKLISSCFASLPLKIPGTAFYRGMKACDRMFAVLDSIISKRRSGSGFRQDFLQSLLKKHSKDTVEEDEDKLTDKQLKDNILTLLIAGHEPCSLLVMIPQRLVSPGSSNFWEEHMEILCKREGRTTLTWSEVNNMPYNKVISETLWRATILPWFSRKAAQDFEIDGYNIQKG